MSGHGIISGKFKAASVVLVEDSIKPWRIERTALHPPTDCLDVGSLSEQCSKHINRKAIPLLVFVENAGSGGFARGLALNANSRGAVD